MTVTVTSTAGRAAAGPDIGWAAAALADRAAAPAAPPSLPSLPGPPPAAVPADERAGGHAVRGRGSRGRAAVCTAAVLAGAAVLTACGGSGGSDSDKIAGGSPTPAATTAGPTPSATGTAPAGAPAIRLPADVTVSIADPGPGKDAATDEATAGLKYAILALRDGYAQGSGEVPSMLHSYGTQAGLYWSKLIKQFADQGKTITGTYRYYDIKVTLANATSGSATYCEDQRQAYAKIRKTGRVLRTDPSKDDFFLNTVQLAKEGGAWKVLNVVWKQGDSACVRN